MFKYLLAGTNIVNYAPDDGGAGGGEATGGESSAPSLNIGGKSFEVPTQPSGAPAPVPFMQNGAMDPEAFANFNAEQAQQQAEQAKARGEGVGGINLTAEQVREIAQGGAPAGGDSGANKETPMDQYIKGLNFADNLNFDALNKAAEEAAAGEEVGMAAFPGLLNQLGQNVMRQALESAANIAKAAAAQAVKDNQALQDKSSEQNRFMEKLYDTYPHYRNAGIVGLDKVVENARAASQGNDDFAIAVVNSYYTSVNNRLQPNNNPSTQSQNSANQDPDFWDNFVAAK